MTKHIDFENEENWELLAWMDEEFARNAGFIGDSADLTVMKYKGDIYNGDGILKHKNQSKK